MKILGLLFRWILSVIFILMGPVYVIGGIAMVSNARATRNWPQAAGVITSSEVVQHRGRGVSYTPEIAYEYQVGDSMRRGSHIWLEDFGAGEERARKLVAEFPAGTAVTVFYAPNGSARSVLKTGPHYFMYANSLIGLVALVVGIASCPAIRWFRK